MVKKKQTKESFFPEAIREELDKAYKIIEGKYYRDISKGMDAHERLHTVDVRVEKEKMIESLKKKFKKIYQEEVFIGICSILDNEIKDQSSPTKERGR